MRKLLPFLGLLLFALPAKAAPPCSSTALGNSVICVQSVNTGLTGTFFNPGFGSNTTNGNLVVEQITVNNSTATFSVAPTMTCTTLTATTSSPVQNAGNTQTWIYYGVTTGGCKSAPFTLGTSSAGSAVLTEYSGVAASTPLDCDAVGTGNSTALLTATCNTQSGSASASMTAGTSAQWAIIMAAFKTLTGTSDLLVGAGGSGTSGQTWTAGGTYTLLDQNNGTNHAGATEGNTQTLNFPASKIVGPSTMAGPSTVH